MHRIFLLLFLVWCMAMKPVATVVSCPEGDTDAVDSECNPPEFVSSSRAPSEVFASSNTPRILQYRQTLALPPVVWRAPIGCDNSGFFVEILAYFIGLISFFEPETLFLDIGKCSHFSSFTEKDATMLKSLQASFSSPAAPAWKDAIVIHHKLPGQALPPFLSSSRYLVGRMMSESSIISRADIHQARVLDEIWVPSAFHVSVFEGQGVPREKLHIVPEAVDVQFYSDDALSPSLPSLPPRRGFRFLSIFKYERRKGADILLSTYWKTFRKEENVELVIRSYKPSWSPGSADLNKVFNNLAKKEFDLPMSELATVLWLQRDLSKKELRALYQSADVFVLPTRGEGWCLPCAEAMAVGMPLIVTNFSGPSAYLSNDHSYPLSYSLQLNADGFAEPDSSHLSDLLEHVVTHPDEVREKATKAKLYAAKHFEPSVVALRVIKRLNAINSKLSEQPTFSQSEL